MTFLFWNLKSKLVPELVKGLVDDHRVDIVAIAEPPVETPWLLESLPDFQQVMLASRLQLFTRNRAVIKVVHEAPHYSIAAIRPKGPELLFAVAHLPSKLHADGMDQAYSVREFASAIREQESKHGHRRTLVMG